MDFGHDPLDLLSVAMIYKSKISYSLPHFAAITFTAIAFLALVPNLVPVIPVPPVTRRVAAVSGLVAAMLSGGAMTLQQVTSGAVANLVTQVSTGGIEVDMGNSAVGFGWAAFALTAVAAVAVAAVVAAEIAREKAEQKAREYVNKGVEKASGGRVDLENLGAFGGWNSKKAAGADTTERKPSGESGYAGSGYASYAAGFGRSMNEGHPAFGRGPGGSSNASGIPRPSSAAVALATKLFQKR